MRIAIYPGTFDPVTYGHLDVIERAICIFDKVIVAVATNAVKNPLFSEAERIAILNSVLRKNKKVEIDSFQGLLVDYAAKRKATAVVRGLRAVSDFEYEFQMALMNRKLAPGLSTVFLMPHERYTYLNSTIVRELAQFGGDVSEFVPPVVRRHLKKKHST